VNEHGGGSNYGKRSNKFSRRERSYYIQMNQTIKEMQERLILFYVRRPSPRRLDINLQEHKIEITIHK
jgi:hypothetical protein